MGLSRNKSIPWNIRLQGLAASVRDVVARSDTFSTGASGVADHHALFERYVEALAAAKVSTDEWWNGLIISEQNRTKVTTEVATTVIEERWPVGRAGSPEVVTVLRNAWLECETINTTLPAAQQVPPEELTLLWLLRPETEPLAKLLADLPFLPMGLGIDGHWL